MSAAGKLLGRREIWGGRDVRTFVFSAKDGRPFSSEPGQFITVVDLVALDPLVQCLRRAADWHNRFDGGPH
ncbi:hypothetical protein C6P97_30895 [Burkholderia multivorans]|uniref:Uncharacterized protein n=1 Tax=Burkholderia multivorans TaxID=87883 RepID=A0AB37ARN3_9BURK|nr:hypothetical protein C6P97_30895 [Burkholderia multivorans]PRE42284.1 hypothetical protein C6P99_24710 [Burkholderia multivorans]